MWKMEVTVYICTHTLIILPKSRGLFCVSCFTESFSALLYRRVKLNFFPLCVVGNVRIKLFPFSLNLKFKKAQ